MNIKILYDNEAKLGFQSGWGFSALIDDSTLFDMGENEDSLLANIQAFGIDLSKIRRVVLSHDDWDHIGGIGLIADCGVVDVYVPAGTSSLLRGEITALNVDASIYEVTDSVEIVSGVFVTSCLGVAKKEISLAVRVKEGLVLVTGCAHPGLETIIEEVRKIGSIYAVLGGFHGFSKLEALVDVPLIAPCHCTTRKAQIADRFPEQVRAISAGIEMDIGDGA